MRYLVIFMSGKEERFYADTFVGFMQLLDESVRRYGPFDLIYTLGRGR